MSDLQAKKDQYMALLHAMQTGVMYDQEFNPGADNAKHLRVGINSALNETGAIWGLLLEKGIITEEEMWDALIAKLEEEVEKYQKIISNRLGGVNITLG